MENIDENLKRIQEKVSQDLKIPFETLKENRNIIKNIFFGPFATRLLFGNHIFPDILKEAGAKDENDCVYISEKIISRAQTIYDLEYNIDLNDDLKKEVENAKLLWNVVQYNLIPLEQFWCLEKTITDDGLNLNDEYFEYLMYIANYYLKETEKYYKLHTKKQKKLLKHQN